MASASNFFLRPDLKEIESELHARVPEVTLTALWLGVDEDGGGADPCRLTVLASILDLLDKACLYLVLEQRLAGVICGLSITEANLHKPRH